MAVDDYPSGLNARRHQNKLGTAISDSGTGGPRWRPANPRKWSTPRGSFLVDLRRLRFCKSYIGCPEHFNPLQRFVLTCAMFSAALLAHPIHSSIDVLLLTHDATPARGNGWPSESILSSLNPV
jgi:hypothetical protein